MPSMLSDTVRLTPSQQEQMCALLFQALIEVRWFLWQGQPERAVALVDAIHNVPNHLLNDFSLRYFRMGLESYAKTHGTMFPLLAMLEQIENQCPTPPSAPEKS